MPSTITIFNTSRLKYKNLSGKNDFSIRNYKDDKTSRHFLNIYLLENDIFTATLFVIGFQCVQSKPGQGFRSSFFSIS